MWDRCNFYLAHMPAWERLENKGFCDRNSCWWDSSRLGFHDASVIAFTKHDDCSVYETGQLAKHSVYPPFLVPHTIPLSTDHSLVHKTIPFPVPCSQTQVHIHMPYNRMFSNIVWSQGCPSFTASSDKCCI